MLELIKDMREQQIPGERKEMAMELEAVLSKIRPASPEAYDACIHRFNHIAKPVGSLGKLETLLATVAAASGSAEIDIGKKCVMVYCADNGVLAQGVAQSTHEVTTVIARSLTNGTACVNAMAKAVGADVFPVDMGMIDPVEGMLDRSIARGTGDISRGPAMTREQAVQAILTGVEQVRQRKAQGYRLIATGEGGIGNTTTSSAILSVLLHQSVKTVTGRGSGLSDEGLERKRRAIERAVAVNRLDPADPLDVLSKLGGFDICAMAGTFLGGAVYGIPVVMDGFISGTAALCAVMLHPNVRGYILPSHVTAEPAGELLMEKLGFSPVLHGDMRLGEGTGAVALMSLLDLSAAVYHHAATFERLEMEAYNSWKSN